MLMSPLEWLYTKYPHIIENMKKTTQHAEGHSLSPYHLEGNVLVHSLMVYNHMDLQMSNVPDHMRMAALLHDIGKIFTKDVEDGIARFKGHEGRSFFESIDIVKEYVDYRYNQLDKDAKDTLVVECLVCIANHGLFLHNKTMTNEELDQKMRVLSSLVVASLSKLISADRKGRILSETKQDFMLHSNDCSVKLLDIVDERHGGYTIKESYSQKELIIMVGLPGSGKSTYIRKELTCHYIISRDALIMESSPMAKTYEEAWKNVDQDEIDNLLLQKFQYALKTEDKIVVDMTNMSKKSRRKWINQAKQRDYVIKAYVMTTDIDQCIQRRSDGVKTVPYSVIDRMANSFTFPLGDEVDFVKVII